MNLRIDIDNFLQTPQVVLYGMLGTFTALAVIYIAILVLGKVSKEKAGEDN